MTGRPVVLVVDDQIANIEIVCAALDDAFEISFALSGEQALDVARAAGPDVILLDVMMPGMDGYEVCRRLKQDTALSDVPVIFTTSLDAPEAELRGLSAGAIDYVTKPFQPDALRRRVGNHVELKRMRDRLAALAMQDPLTGLGNRRLLEQRLAAELRRLGRDGGWLSVMMLDIDHFKLFNDRYGHPEGDRCLQQVAAVLSRQMQRGQDAAARYGGEEFACILPDTDHAGAMRVAEAIRAEIAALAIAHDASPTARTVTVSIGVATAACAPGMAPETLLDDADRMLNASKQAGRNRVTGQDPGSYRAGSAVPRT